MFSISFSIITTLITLIISFYGVRSFTFKYNELNYEYLGYSNNKSIRGIFALIVIQYHISLLFDTGYHSNIIDILNNIFLMRGDLSVSIFFFLSGYGIQKGYMKNDNYRNGFLKRRFATVLIPYVIMNIVCIVVGILMGKEYSLEYILDLFIYGVTLVPYSWYVVVILLFYIFSYFAMFLCQRKRKMMILFSILFYVIFYFLCIKINVQTWWYGTAYLVIFGTFWASYEKQIIKVLQKYYYIFSITLLIIFILCILFRIYGNLNFKLDNKIIFIFNVLFLIIFTTLVILLCMKFKLENKVLTFFGNISFELYLCQGLFVMNLKKYIPYNIVCCLCIIVFTIIFSIIFNKIT